jgi:hypothetical protein
MRSFDDLPHAKASETSPQVRSAFLRDGAQQCRWPADFVPALSHDDPEIADLAERLWHETRPALEASDEGLNRLSFKQAIDQAASDLFSHADVGIKALASAKQLLGAAFAQVETAGEVVAAETAPAEAPPWDAEPALVARLDASPPSLTDITPGQAKLCLSVGDVVLKVDLQVPSQSWLYQGYQRLRETLEQSYARAKQVRLLPKRPGRLGMMTDDRELTVGLRHQRRPEGEHLQRETTLSLRSRR